MTLQNLLDTKKITQCFLAKEIGKTQQAISRWARGITSPCPKDIICLAKILEVSEREILDCFKKEA